MCKRILVPLDGSPWAESVLPHVVAMAHAFSAPVNLIQIIEQSAQTESSVSVDPFGWRLKKNEADSYLSHIKEELGSSEIDVEQAVLEGRAIDQIMKFALEKAADLMVLSSYSQTETDFGRWDIGATVQRILQRGFISTLIIRTHPSFATLPGKMIYQRLLVPLDGSRRAEAVLPTAMLLAQAFGAELLLVRVVNAPDMARRMPLTTEENQLVQQLIDSNSAEAEQYLAQLQTRITGQSRVRLTISDNVTAAIQEIAEQEHCDLMIMSAHGYSGSPKWPYGNVTNRFITNGTIPLLVIQDLPVENSASSVEYSDNSVRSGAR
jgi:nucleotide-binding universal stress UspA family protein